jgi:GTP-binding protein HflX
MFATLDPTSRRLRLPREQEVIINDTVGFIRALPPDLISAFRATLEEIHDSILLIHAVDISNSRWPQQIQAVKRILSELQLAEIPSILALNKCDLVDPAMIESIVSHAHQLDAGEAVVISAINQASLGSLLEKAGAVLARNLASEPAYDTAAEFAVVSQIA